MKRTTILLSLGLAAMAATATEAADWNNGARGLKDHGGLAGVPVPAPVPVLESFNWYLRADLGYAVKSQGNATVTTALGATISQNYDNNEGPFLGTLGFGRYMTDSLRWDITGDYRGAQKTRAGTTSYLARTVTAGPDVTIGANTVSSRQINTFNVSRSEEVRMANHAFLANLYYDFNRGGGFNPYIGAGLGITLREGKAEYEERATCAFTTNDVTGVQQVCTEPSTRKAGKPTNMNYGLGAALMAGFTYEIRQGILIDTGYRLSWQGGTTSFRPAGSGDLIYGDARTDHEIRAGLRWNVW